MAVLSWEMLLTRLYSVLLYYHFAFLAVSVAMFGLTIGSLLAYGLKSDSLAEMDEHLASLAALTGFLMAAAMTTQIVLIPPPMVGLVQTAAFWIRIYILSSLPFIPAGIYISLMLTRFENPGKLYAADLVGAGLAAGTLPLILLRCGGPGAVFATAGLALAAACLHTREKQRRPFWIYATFGILFLGFGLLNPQHRWLSIRWSHNRREPPIFFESWNAFSRIIVTPWSRVPFGWGIDPENRANFKPIPQLFMQIDSGAGTPVTYFDGQNTAPLSYLKLDITNFAHHLRPHSDVLVIGVGGARDILSALVFQQKSVHGVEVNPLIVQADNDVFGDFTGHLDRRPDVHFVVNEGRSYLAQTHRQFDIIQASLVDTAAAAAAGAYSFVENSLYTVEAWRLYLQKLTPHGVVSFSRWYYGSTDWPVEICRLTALATEALRQEGVAHPEQNLMVVKNRITHPGEEGLATLVASPSAFSKSDVHLAQEICRALKCEVAQSPASVSDPWLRRLSSDVIPGGRYDRFALDVSPSTDDRPYFFFHARLRDVFLGRDRRQFGGSAFNLPAVRILLELFGIVCVLALLTMWGSYIWLKQNRLWTPGVCRPRWCVPTYFAAIGVAYMFFEIALMQRYSIVLGHPTYGFTVVLLGLLAASGIGSYFSNTPRNATLWRSFYVIALADVGLHISGVVPYAYLSTWPTPGRILATWALLAPMGILMGTFFPQGMAYVLEQEALRGPWYWAMNGACSVVGSVLAMMISMEYGLERTLWIGVLLYAAAQAIQIRLRQQAPGM